MMRLPTLKRRGCFAHAVEDAREIDRNLDLERRVIHVGDRRLISPLGKVYRVPDDWADKGRESDAGSCAELQEPVL